MRYHVAGDYHGSRLVPFVVRVLEDMGHTVVSYGCTKEQAKASEYGHKNGDCDVATIAQKALKNWDKSDRGVFICGSGIGMSIAANKHKEVIAARVLTAQEAQYSVEHDGANVITLAEHQLNEAQTKAIIEAFAEATEDDIPRHIRQRTALKLLNRYLS